MELPDSRSDWWGLDWKKAQQSIAVMLKREGFMIFEEKTIDKAKRADVFVIRQNKNEAIFGVIEVKAYDKMTPGIEKKALIQACKYMNSVFADKYNNGRWQHKEKKFFVVAVFTKDYTRSFRNYTISDFAKYLPTILLENEKVQILTATPSSILRKLRDHHLLGGKQTNLSTFFQD